MKNCHSNKSGIERVNMSRYRLVNCDFCNSSAFTKLSSGAKMLYYSILLNADDIGFIDSVEDLIKRDGLNNQASEELVLKGLLLQFNNHHGDSVYLVKHWFMHNKWKDRLYSRYYKLLTENNLKAKSGKYVKVDPKQQAQEEDKKLTLVESEDTDAEFEDMSEQWKLPFDR